MHRFRHAFVSAVPWALIAVLVFALLRLAAPKPAPELALIAAAATAAGFVIDRLAAHFQSLLLGSHWD